MDATYRHPDTIPQLTLVELRLERVEGLGQGHEREGLHLAVAVVGDEGRRQVQVEAVRFI